MHDHEGIVYLPSRELYNITAKFQTMLVKSNNIDDIELNVTAENVSLPSSDTMKVLGIDIDNRLTFDGHVSNMYIKAEK